MGNLSEIYHTHITQKEFGGNPSKDERLNFEHEQLRVNWLNSTITLEMISSINKEIEENMLLALSLANNYAVNKNADKIVQTLNHINTLKKVLETYASR